MRTVQLLILVGLFFGATCLADEPTRLFKAEDSESGLLGSLGQMAKGLGLSLGVLFLGLGIYRRFVIGEKGVASRRISVKERISLTPRSSLILIAVDGKEMLIATGSDSARLIKVIAEESQCFETTLSEQQVA